MSLIRRVLVSLCLRRTLIARGFVAGYTNSEELRSVNYNAANSPLRVTKVEGSNGDFVEYRYNGDGFLTEAEYRDGTIAKYAYGDTTYVADDTLGGLVTVTKKKLLRAQDYRAESAMQSVQYEYVSNGKFEGQIAKERYFSPDANIAIAPSTPGVAVSSLTSNSLPAYRYPSNEYADGTTATQTETRGDGPSRTFTIATANKVPLVRSKSDYKGVLEHYGYNAANFVTSVKDRKQNTTNYTLEPVLGNPKRITHPDTRHIDYTYTNAMDPYYVSTVTDELLRKTTYTRDSLNRITRIDYPNTSYETFTYNSYGQVTIHRRRNGAYDHAQYSPGGTGVITGGLLVAIWNPTSSATRPAAGAADNIQDDLYLLS